MHHSESALRILQLTNRIPYPFNDGGSIGIHYYIEGYLKAGAELSLLAMNTTRHWVNPEKLPPLYRQLGHFETVRVDNRLKPLPALISLIRGGSYHLERFISKDYEAALLKMLSAGAYDIIHLDGLYLTPYIPLIRRHSGAKVVMRLHNPEFRIWERLAAQEKAVLKKWYLGILAKRLKAFELARMADYDLILALSEEDAAFYRHHGCTAPIYIHPFGIDATRTSSNPRSEIHDPKCYHLGAMDWLPNQESVDWLLKNVWPLVMLKNPGARLYLAGRNMPQKYFEQQTPGVEVVGEVPDADAFEADKDILLVPLLSGGGVRIKIYRGMAAGKAVVTTSIGVEGIDARDGKEVMIADSAADFAARILSLLGHPEEIAALGRSAAALMADRYDAPVLMEALMGRYRALIAGH